MAELWKSIESHVVAALIALIPLITAAVASWLRAKTRKWNLAKDSTLEAAELGAKFNSEVPDAVIEEWAVSNLHRRATEEKTKLGDGEARELVRKVRDKLKQSSGHNGTSASGSAPVSPPPKSDPPTG